MLKYTHKSDLEIYEIVADELKRQEHNIEMIASESSKNLEQGVCSLGDIQPYRRSAILPEGFYRIGRTFL